MKKFLTICILALLVALPYLPTLRYGFLFDDYHLIVRNENLSKTSDLSHYFFETHSWQHGYANYYRPMMYASLMLNQLISGNDAWSYHIFNVITNLLAAFLVYLIAKNLFLRINGENSVDLVAGIGDKAALLAAVLFALHPIHTEAVTNIAGRADIMMTFWILLGVVIAVKAYAGNIQVSCLAGWFVGICALAAGLTKETGFLFMPVIFLYYFLFYTKKQINKINKLRVWIAGCAGTAFAISMYIFVQTNASNVNRISYLDNFCPFVPLEQRIKTAVYLIGKSIKLLFIPYPLSSDYSFAQITPKTTFLTLYSVLAVITISCGLLWSWKKPASPSKKITEFAILWFILCYIFSSNIFFPIGTIFGERLLYLASVGFCIAAAWWIYQIKSRMLRRIVLLPVIIAYILLIFSRNVDWANSENFYRAMRKSAPRSAKAHFSSAKLALDNSEYKLAAKHLNNSLAIFPAFPEAHGLLSTVFLHEQNYSNAFIEASRAIRLNPYVPAAHYTLSRIYRKRGEKEKSEKHYKFAEELMSTTK